MARRDDSEITGDVMAALGASPRARATDIRVHTRGGWVRLEGVVNTLEEKVEAEEVARAVEGVVGVENDLVISSDGLTPDLEIERAANDLLNTEGITGIGVRVEAGTAFLMGVVPNVAAKERAFDVVAKVKGVRDIVSELEIAAGEPIDDTALANDVAEALSDNPDLEIADLDVQVHDGDVLLSGEVSDRRQKEMATRVAESVPGVRSVRNQLTIRRIAS